MRTANNLPDERDLPDVTADESSRTRRAVMILIGLGATVGIGAYALASFSASQVETVSAEKVKPIQSSVPVMTFRVPDPPQPPAPPEPVKAAAIEAKPVPVVAPQAQPAKTKVVYKPAPAPRVDKSATGSRVETDAPTTQGVQVAQANTGSGGNSGGLFGDSGGAGGSTGGSALGDALTPTRVDGVSAVQLGNLDSLLQRGTSIRCALKTRIDTSVVGMSTCQTIGDVYSFDKSRLLIPAGSHVTGEYRSAVQGSNRVSVLWSRLVTPSGVAVDLDSLATGPLGASGIQGTVDNKFWQRLGVAVLVSIISDASRAQTNNTTGDVIIGGAAQTGGQLATEILKDSIGIQPTIGVHHGAITQIMVARDISFSGVL